VPYCWNFADRFSESKGPFDFIAEAIQDLLEFCKTYGDETRVTIMTVKDMKIEEWANQLGDVPETLAVLEERVNRDIYYDDVVSIQQGLEDEAEKALDDLLLDWVKKYVSCRIEWYPGDAVVRESTLGELRAGPQKGQSCDPNRNPG